MALQGKVDAEDGTQRTDFTFGRKANAFEGRAATESGSLDMSIEMVRASSLLWINGPNESWESFCYDATPAIGKYVVFEAAWRIGRVGTAGPARWWGMTLQLISHRDISQGDITGSSDFRWGGVRRGLRR